jgi:hypothetical protein
MERYLKYKKKYLNLKNQSGGNIYTITKKCYKDNFLEFIRSNGEQFEDYYFVILNISGINYNCVIYLNDENDILIYFISNKYENKQQIIENLDDISFIILYFDSIDEITTKLYFEKMHGKNKLDTIMEILEYMYIHFCRDVINLIDVAEFSCGEKYEYDAIIYRILGTDKDINNLSIYGKYEYKSDCYNQIQNLEYIRNFTIIDFIHLIEINADKLIKYIDIYKLICELNDRQFEKVSEFYKYIAQIMTDIENCKQYFMYFNIINILLKSKSDYKNFIKIINEIKKCVNNISKILLLT